MRHKAHAIVTKYKTKMELIQYIHGCFFIPYPQIIIRAINDGNFIPWDGLNIMSILWCLPPSIATPLFHTDQDRSNLQ